MENKKYNIEIIKGVKFTREWEEMKKMFDTMIEDMEIDWDPDLPHFDPKKLKYIAVKRAAISSTIKKIISKIES